MFTMDDYFRATGIEQLKFEVMCEQVGHEPISTFWMDFTIAEGFGESAIRDTYKRAVDEWGEDVEYMAELTLVLNWKIWDLYHTKEELAHLYDEMWRKHDEYC